MRDCHVSFYILMVRVVTTTAKFNSTSRAAHFLFSPVLFRYSAVRLQSDDMALQRSAHILLFTGFCALLLVSVAEGKRKARDLTPYCGGKPLSVDGFMLVLSAGSWICVVVAEYQFLCVCVFIHMQLARQLLMKFDIQ